MVAPSHGFSSRYNNSNNNNGHDDDSVTTWGRHEREENLRQRQSHNQNEQRNTDNRHPTSARKQATPQQQQQHQEFLSPSSSNSPESTIFASRPKQQTPSNKQQRLEFPKASPMTQTLNVLSQNMDDLRYDAAVSMLQLDHRETKKTDKNNDKDDCNNNNKAVRKEANQSNTTTKPREDIRADKQTHTTQDSKAKKTNQRNSTTKSSSSSTKIRNDSHSKDETTCTKNADSSNDTRIVQHSNNDLGYILWKDYQDRYTRQNVYIPITEQDSSVGMRIQKSNFFSSSDKPIHCRVLKTFGLATKHGIQTGDWIAWPMCDEYDHVRLATSEKVQEWAKERPVVFFCIVRKKKDEECSSKKLPSKEVPKKAKKNAGWIDKDGFSGVNPDDSVSKPKDVSKDVSKRSPLFNNNKKHPLVTPQSGKPKQVPDKPSTGSNSGRDRLSGKNEPSGRLLDRFDKNVSTPLDHGKKQSVTAPRKKITERDNLSKITPSKIQQESNKKRNTVPPYCFKCNTPAGSKAPRIHHAWCPKNDFFETSGAKEIYQRMQHGLEIDCKACQVEHELGKIQKRVKHEDRCVAYYKKLQEEAEEDSSESEAPTPPMPKKKKPAPAAKKKRPSISAYTSFSSSSDDSDDDGDEDVSCYRPRKKKQKIHTISLAASKPKSRESDAQNTKKHSKNQKMVTKAKQHSSKIAAKSQPKKQKKKSQAASKAKSKKKQGTSLVSTSRSKPTRDETLSPEDDHEESESPPPRLKDPPRESEGSSRKQPPKLRWISCEDDPWGPAGYVDGDVLLYGPQEGIPNQSVMIPSQRFTLQPFAAGSSYRNTHCTPEEGYSMLMLRREPMGRRPWGMKVIWDEFGHACLIDSVDPLSPAAAATYIGCNENTNTTDAGLRVNDMVLSVNGKLVGGMTEVQLEVELETSGPSLLLVISRYKHANHVKQKFLEVERRILHVMDSAARDDRLIGWTEIGNGAVNSPSPSKEGHSDVENFPETGPARGHLVPTFERAEMGQSSHASVEADLAEKECAEGAGEKALPKAVGEDLQYSSSTSQAVDEEKHLAAQPTVGAEVMSPLQIAREEIQNSPNSSQTNNEQRETGGASREEETPLDAPGSDDPEHPEITTVVVDLRTTLEDNQQAKAATAASVGKDTREDGCDNISTLSFGRDDTAQSFSPGIKSTGEDSIAHKKHTSQDPGNSSGSSGDDGDWENDPHAWSGCMCGATHENSKKEVYWIQCDCCNTWYNVAAKCVGFSEKEAVALSRWTCWGCPPSSISHQEESKNPEPDSPELLATSNGTDASKNPNDLQGVEEVPSNKASGSKGRSKGRKTRRTKRRREIYARDGSMCPETPSDDIIPSEHIGKNTKDVYQIGDDVYVKSHSWSGKNCQGGVGKVAKGPYEDSSGDPCYTVRYAVGHSEKFIEVEYISPYSFAKASKRRKRGS